MPAPSRPQSWLQRWIAPVPFAVIVEGNGIGAWAAYFVGGAITLALTAGLGATLFGVPLLPAALVFLLTPTFGAVVLLLLRRPAPPITLVQGLDFSASFGVFLFFGYCATTGTPAAEALFGAIFMGVAAWYGVMYHATLAAPLPALLALVGAGVWALVPPHGRSDIIAGILGVAGASMAVIAGVAARGNARRRHEIESLREAVQAQIDAERETTLSAFHESLTTTAGLTHDIANVAQRVLGDGEALAAHCTDLKAQVPDWPEWPEIADTIGDFRAGLHELDVRIKESRRALRQHRDRSVHFDLVAPAALLPPVAAELKRRFPRVEVALPDGAGPACRARLRGGEAVLRRILENLLVNACEGDGRAGARRIECALGLDETGGLLRLEVRDDGPGFPPELVASGVVGLRSSKPEGTGLGLYTVERLLRQSGGALRIANRPTGGAVVTVLLPVAAS